MSSAPTSAPVASGTLDQYPLPTLLFYLYKKRFTGSLVLSGEASGQIFFRDGMPVHAEHPTMPYESLARALLDLNLLADSAYERVLEYMASTGSIEADSLREMADTTDEELSNAHKHILRRKLNQFFKSSQGGFALYADEHPHAVDPAEAEARRVHPRRVIYHGIRNTYDEARVQRELGDALTGKVVRIPQDRVANLERYGFLDDEKVVIDLLCQSPWTIEDLAHTGNRGEFEMRMLVYALLATEMLELKERPASRASRPPPAAPAEVAAPPPRVPAQAPTRHAKAIGETGSRPAMQQPAAAATARPAGRPAAPTPPPAGAGDKAAALRAQIEAKSKTIAKEDLFAVLGVPKTATKVDIKKAYIEAAKTFHPDRLAQFGLDALRADVEQIFARVNEANALLSDDAKRAQYLEAQASGEVPSPEAERELRKALSAEIEFQKGEMMLKQRQFAKAEEHLKNAVDANPDIEHQVALAWARYNNPANNREAIKAAVKEVFAKAAKERPALGRVHAYMGEIYLNDDLPGSAERAFEKAVQLAPENVDAQRGLRLAQTRKSKGGGKKEEKEKDSGAKDEPPSKIPFAGLFSKKKK